MPPQRQGGQQSPFSKNPGNQYGNSGQFGGSGYNNPQMNPSAMGKQFGNPNQNPPHMMPPQQGGGKHMMPPQMVGGQTPPMPIPGRPPHMTGGGGYGNPGDSMVGGGGGGMPPGGFMPGDPMLGGGGGMPPGFTTTAEGSMPPGFTPGTAEGTYGGSMPPGAPPTQPPPGWSPGARPATDPRWMQGTPQVGQEFKPPPDGPSQFGQPHVGGQGSLQQDNANAVSQWEKEMQGYLRDFYNTAQDYASYQNNADNPATKAKWGSVVNGQYKSASQLNRERQQRLQEKASGYKSELEKMYQAMQGMTNPVTGEQYDYYGQLQNMMGPTQNWYGGNTASPQQQYMADLFSSMFGG